MGSHASLRRSRHCVKRHDSFDLGSFYTLYEDPHDDEVKDDAASCHPGKGRDVNPDEGPWLLISQEETGQVPSPFAHSQEASTVAALESGRSTTPGTSHSAQDRCQENFRNISHALAHDDSPYGPASTLMPAPLRQPNDAQHLQVRPTLALPAITRSESRFSEFVQEPKALLPELGRERGWHKYATVLGGFLACVASLGFLSTIAALHVSMDEYSESRAMLIQCLSYRL
jgi:hypothetical protein